MTMYAGNNRLYHGNRLRWVYTRGYTIPIRAQRLSLPRSSLLGSDPIVSLGNAGSGTGAALEPVARCARLRLRGG